MNLQEAKAALKGGTELQMPWYKNELDGTVCLHSLDYWPCLP
jgi:hypothetical protein